MSSNPNREELSQERRSVGLNRTSATRPTVRDNRIEQGEITRRSDPDAFQQARQNAVKQFDQGLPNIDVTEDDLVVTDSGFQLSEEAQRRSALEKINEKVEGEVTAEDIEQRGDNDFVLSKEARKELAAERIDEEVGDEANANVTAGDLVEDEDGSGFQLNETVGKRIASHLFRDSTGISKIYVGHIKRTDDGFALNEVGQQIVRGQKSLEIAEDLGIDKSDVSTAYGPPGEIGISEAGQREIARNEAIENLQQQTDATLSEEAIEVEQTDSAIEARISDQFRREQAAENLQQQTEADIPREAIEIQQRDGEIEATTAEDYLEEQAVQNLQEQTEADIPREAIEIQQRDGEIEATIAEGFQREQAIENLQEQTEVDIPREAIEIRRRDGEIEATTAEDYLEEQAVQNLQEQTEADIPREAIEVTEQPRVTPGDVPEDVEQRFAAQTGTEVEATVSEDFVREQAIENLQEQTEADIPREAIEVEQTDEGVRAEVSANALVADEIESELLPGLEANPEDISVDDGDVEVTGETEQAIEVTRQRTPDDAVDVYLTGDEFGENINTSANRAIGQETIGRVATASGGSETVDILAGIEDRVVELTPGTDIATDIVGSSLEATAGQREVARDIVGGAGEQIIGVLDAGAEQADRFVVDPVARGAGATVDLASVGIGEYLGRDYDVDNLTRPDTAGGQITQRFIDTGLEGLASVPADAAKLVPTTADATEFAVSEIEADGVVEGSADIAAETGETASGVGRYAFEYAQDNPARAAGGLILGGGGSVLVESAVVGRLERGAAALRARRQADTDLNADLGDLTTERGQSGSLPEFETSPSARGEVAASEIRRRSREQIDELQDLADSDQVLLRSEGERLPGDLETGRGNFELPGLFASPDLSPLRLDVGSETSSGLSLRLPRLSQPQRVSAFESPDIEAMPPSAAESGFAVRSGDEIVERFGPGEGGAANQLADAIDGERIPDPDTAGAQFLNEFAEPGTAFVRPRGDRTTELEAIFPPESRFERVGTGRVNTGDRPATLDVFQRVETEDGSPVDFDGDADDLLSPAEVSQRATREQTVRADDPVTPPTSTLGRSSDTTAQTTGSTATDSNFTSPTDVFDRSAFDEFGSDTSSPSDFSQLTSGSDIASGASSAGSFMPSSTGPVTSIEELIETDVSTTTSTTSARASSTGSSAGAFSGGSSGGGSSGGSSFAGSSGGSSFGSSAPIDTSAASSGGSGFASGLGGGDSTRRPLLPDPDTDNDRTAGDDDFLADQERFVLEVPDPTDIGDVL